MQDERWLNSLEDPFRERLISCDPEELPAAVLACAEPMRGEPAFEADRIDRIASELPPTRPIELGHPLLDRSVRVGLAHILATFRGSHPKYGVGAYAADQHDSFPPTIVAAIDALTLWGLIPLAEEMFEYWLRTFVKADGAIDYYGPSLSEYGQLLTTARRVMERGGSSDWLARNRDPLSRMAEAVRQWIRPEGEIDLPTGVPEADEAEFPAAYFHNAAWLVRGLRDWAELSQTADSKADAEVLRDRLLREIEDAWPEDESDWWLRPTREPEREGYWERPIGQITQNRFGSYTNYRYWPELLSSGVLPEAAMARIVRARLTGGGQFIGNTRFDRHLDNWPLMDYLEGLRQLGRLDDYLLCLWGHIAYGQAEGHLTAYEQFSFPPGGRVADYCLPAQLVAARAAPWLAAR